MSKIRSDVIAILNIGIGISVGEISLLMMFSISTAFLSRTNPNDVASAALGLVFANGTGHAPGIGLCGALDTLIFQDYGANKKSKRVGLHLQRAAVVMLVYSLVVILIWWFGAPLLYYVASAEVAAGASLWLRAYSLGLPAVFLSVVMKRYLQCQKLTRPIAGCQVVAMLVSIIFQWLFVWQFKLGIVGAAIALSCSVWCIPLFLLICIRAQTAYQDTWPSFSCEVFREWPEFFRLGIPNMFMTMSEWLTYDALILISSVGLGTSQLAATSILVNILLLLFQPPFGCQCGVAVCVGHKLGSNEYQDAKKLILSGYSIAFVCAVINFCILFFGAPLLAAIYDPYDEDVKRIMISTLRPIVALIGFCDCIQSIPTGVFRACGRQNIGFMVNFVCLWCVVIPMACLSTFVFGFGVIGIWVSTLVGFVVLCFVGAVTIWYVLDWKRLQEEAAVRTTPTSRPAGSYGTFETGETTEESA